MKKYTPAIKITFALFTILATMPSRIKSMEQSNSFDLNKMLAANQRIQQNQQIEFVKNVLLWVAAHEKELKAHVPQEADDKRLVVHNPRHTAKQELTVGFNDLPDDLVYPIACSLEYGEDAYALGATNKRFAKSLLHDYIFLAHLVEKRMIPPFSVESTRAFLNVNAEFRDICKGKVTRFKQRTQGTFKGIFAAEDEKITDSETQIKMLESLYDNANGLIALDTCTKKIHGSSCVIPLASACIQNNSNLATFLIEKKADVNLVPRKVCAAYSFDTLASTALNIGNSHLLPRVTIIKRMAESQPLLLSDTTLHTALAVIFQNPNNETDSRGIRQLIELGAPINGLNHDRQTPLIYLADNAIKTAGLKVGRNSFSNIITSLLDGRANIKAKDSCNCTAESLFTNDFYLSNKADRSLIQNQRELKAIFQNVCNDHAEFIKNRDFEAMKRLKDSENKS